MARKLMGKKAAAAFAAKCGITDDDVKAMVRAAHGVWSSVAYDYFTDVEGVPSSIPRSEVVQVVLDASRWEEAMRRGTKTTPMSPGLTKLFAEINGELHGSNGLRRVRHRADVCRAPLVVAFAATEF